MFKPVVITLGFRKIDLLQSHIADTEKARIFFHLNLSQFFLFCGFNDRYTKVPSNKKPL